MKTVSYNMASYPTPTQPLLPLLPLLRPFPIRGRLILFSFSTIFSLELLFSLYTFLLHVSLYDITPPQVRFSYLSFPLTPIFSSSVFPSTCPYHLCLGFSYFLTYVSHTCPCYYLFCLHLLNPLYSHHPSQHAHLCYF